MTTPPVRHHSIIEVPLSQPACGALPLLCLEGADGEPFVSRIAFLHARALQRRGFSADKACNALEKQGTPITGAAVGHQCVETFGGPKIQSIRNSKDCMALYIQKRAAEQDGVGPKRGVASGGRPAIENEAVRAYVRTLEVQLEQANAELRRVKGGLRQLQPLDTQGISNLLGEVPVTPAAGPVISDQAREDLRLFLDPQRLASCGIKESQGELEFASGLVLLRTDGVSFLKKVAQ